MKLFYILVILSLPFGVYAEKVYIKVKSPWQLKELAGKQVCTMNYMGGRGKEVVFQSKLKPKAYYKFSWIMKKTGSGENMNFAAKLYLGGKAAHYPYVCNGKWNSYSAYFYSGTSSTIKIIVLPLSGKPGNIILKEAKMTRVGTSMFEDNLLGDGDFEKSSVPVEFRTKSKGKLYITSSENFLAGTQKLVLDLQPGCFVTSNYMPIIPGREFTLKFWANAERPITIESGILLKSPFDKNEIKCFKSGKNIKLIEEWGQFSLTFTIPGDIKKYPDLGSRLILIFFRLSPKDKALKVNLNQMTLSLIEQKNKKVK